MSKNTAVIVYDYDEDKEGIFETFGTTAARMSEIVGGILLNKSYKTITQGLVAELQKGNLSGGDLLGLAASDIAHTQSTLGAFAQKLFTRLEGEESEHLCADCDAVDCPDRKKE